MHKTSSWCVFNEYSSVKTYSLPLSDKNISNSPLPSIAKKYLQKSQIKQREESECLKICGNRQLQGHDTKN